MREAGWYSDPKKSFDRRYWDGLAWTNRVQDRGIEIADSGRSRSVPLVRARPEYGSLVLAGYLLAVLIAPVGFFVGFALLLKGRAGHGIAVMVLSVLVTASLLATA